MYKLAYKYDESHIFYFDVNGNKYVASGGNLAWRINNPGLVHTHSHFAGNNRSIGSCGKFAIFEEPQHGRKALSEWLKSKKYYNSNLHIIAEHYQPKDPEAYLIKLTSHTGLSVESKIKSLSNEEFDRLLRGIEKLSGFTVIGDEKFTLLPKITAKLENGKDKEDSYLIGNDVVLSKSEAIEWILSHRLDAVVVRQRDGTLYLRSRPRHCIWNIRMTEEVLPALEGQINTLVRTVGQKSPHQCIWGFINGVSNSKNDALESTNLISTAAAGEMVFSMPNDSEGFGIIDGLVCFVLKFNIDVPAVQWAVQFFRYLLKLSEQDSTQPPVIIFAHSQGAIISEHALELLTPQERQKIRIFTFGGGSFIAPGTSHPDSHNYASASDLVCRLGSPNSQILALQRYYGLKEGLSEEKIIRQLAVQDAMLHLDTLNPDVIEIYTNHRAKHYEQEFSKISNVTVLDPGSQWEHRFNNRCYQNIVSEIITKHRWQQLSKRRIDSIAPLACTDIETEPALIASN